MIARNHAVLWWSPLLPPWSCREAGVFDQEWTVQCVDMLQMQADTTATITTGSAMCHIPMILHWQHTTAQHASRTNLHAFHSMNRPQHSSSSQGSMHAWQLDHGLIAWHCHHQGLIRRSAAATQINLNLQPSHAIEARPVLLCSHATVGNLGLTRWRPCARSWNVDCMPL